MPAPGVENVQTQSAASTSVDNSRGQPLSHPALVANPPSLTASRSDHAFVPEGLALPEVCARVHSHIYTFLAEKTDCLRLRGVQARVRSSVETIAKALQLYGSVFSSIRASAHARVLTLCLCCKHSAAVSIVQWRKGLLGYAYTIPLRNPRPL